MIKSLLEGLTEEQLKQEKILRKRVIEEFKKYRESQFELGKDLVEIHDKIIGEASFKEYLEALGIPRSSAYRWMDGYRQVSKLPNAVVVAAGKRKIDLAQGKYLSAVQEVPPPENPTSKEANQWLDTLEARRKEKKSHSSQVSESEKLSTEERSEATSRAYLKHCQEMKALTANLWGEVPAEERNLEVLQSLMGSVAAEFGIMDPFTVVPDPDPAASNRLVGRLEEMAAEQEEVEEKVAA